MKRHKGKHCDQGWNRSWVRTRRHGIPDGYPTLEELGGLVVDGDTSRRLGLNRTGVVEAEGVGRGGLEDSNNHVTDGTALGLLGRGDSETSLYN